MNLSKAYLSILAFSLFPRIVKSYDWGLTLLDDLPSIFLEPPETTFSAMLRRHEDAIQQAFFRGATPAVSPQFDMSNDPNRFSVALSLPCGLSPEDLHVDFDERSRLLTISGQHELTNEETGYRSVSHFSRSFNVDPFVEVDQLAATMDEEGTLRVAAPKNLSKMQHSIRSIPVVQKALVPPEVEPESTPNFKMLAQAPEVYPQSIPNFKNVVAPPEEANRGDSSNSDPFHVKERVEKNLHHEEQEAAFRKNPNKRLEEPYTGYKTSELRRRH